ALNASGHSPAFHNGLRTCVCAVDCGSALARKRIRHRESKKELRRMTRSRDGTVAAPQLKKDFQASDQPRASSASPTGRGMHDARAALRLPRPDLRLVGSEDVHQWLLPGVFAALFLIGILTAARGWQQVERAAHSASWPYTRGLIVSSEVQAYSSSEGARWRPVVTYLYRVGK